MNTFLPAKNEQRKWHEIDASQFTLGRLATMAAKILRGKHKPSFTPFMDNGDFVVVTNAAKVKLTGRKLTQKQYMRYSGYPGGLKRRMLRDVLAVSPQKVLTSAVRGMLPTNKLRAKMILRLKVVSGDKHTYKIDKKIN